MLKRIRIRGYKSLEDLNITLSPLTLLFGPNGAGKSNFLDALQLLSKMATSRTLREAFDPPYRGKPLESFSLGEKGIKGLLMEDRLSFSIEADLELSDSVVGAVNREIQEMRRSTGDSRSDGGGNTPGRVRERNLRYRVEIEMVPRSGILRVSDEYLAALNSNGQPTRRRLPFFEREGEKIHLRLEGQAHPTDYDRYLDHTVLSMPHYPPHYPHLTAARRELESWLFFYFEPRERMRATGPVKEVRHIGLMGEELAAHLNTLKASKPRQFQDIERAMRLLLPEVDGIDVEVSNLGEVELYVRERNVPISARVLSEGTLRMLGILALTGADEPPSLVGFEEPENGVHPSRIELIASFLRTRQDIGTTQYIVTSHSPVLPDLLPSNSLFVTRRIDRKTHIEHFSTWGPLAQRQDIDRALEGLDSTLTVSERVMRGDFNG